MAFFHKIIWQLTLNVIKQINKSKWESWINNFEIDICQNNNYTFAMYLNYVDFCSKIGRNPAHFFRAFVNNKIHTLTNLELLDIYFLTKERNMSKPLIDYLISSDRIGFLIQILEIDNSIQQDVFLQIIKISELPNGKWIIRNFDLLKKFDTFNIVLALS